MRGIAYTRDQRDRHIKRKEKILRNQRLDNPPHRYNDGEAVNNNIKNSEITKIQVQSLEQAKKQTYYDIGNERIS